MSAPARKRFQHEVSFVVNDGLGWGPSFTLPARESDSLSPSDVRWDDCLTRFRCGEVSPIQPHLYHTNITYTVRSIDKAFVWDQTLHCAAEFSGFKPHFFERTKPTDEPRLLYSQQLFSGRHLVLAFTDCQLSSVWFESVAADDTCERLDVGLHLHTPKK